MLTRRLGSRTQQWQPANNAININRQIEYSEGCRPPISCLAIFVYTGSSLLSAVASLSKREELFMVIPILDSDR